MIADDDPRLCGGTIPDLGVASDDGSHLHLMIFTLDHHGSFTAASSEMAPDDCPGSDNGVLNRGAWPNEHVVADDGIPYYTEWRDNRAVSYAGRGEYTHAGPDLAIVTDDGRSHDVAV